MCSQSSGGLIFFATAQTSTENYSWQKSAEDRQLCGSVPVHSIYVHCLSDGREHFCYGFCVCFWSRSVSLYYFMACGFEREFLILEICDQ
ncbi:hypothetical protein Nepgr_010955 [Nepenthes gracilis]|uniref:Uncharacterized protein n=1 Tax=Nepenthes gracilis TaxID=150966 RepID=A0AAD3SE84_NEPGR|nr:hypothetical protein Nepgr_010955 [Nepenthes gracilis]